MSTMKLCIVSTMKLFYIDGLLNLHQADSVEDCVTCSVIAEIK